MNVNQKPINNDKLIQFLFFQYIYQMEKFYPAHKQPCILNTSSNFYSIPQPEIILFDSAINLIPFPIFYTTLEAALRANTKVIRLTE